jgi:hypothetical protein
VQRHVADLLRRGSGAAAELPARRPGHRAFVVVAVNPKGGFAVESYEISEAALGELEERWESNEDFLDRRWADAADLDGIEEILRGWGLNPDDLVPAWQIDLP